MDVPITKWSLLTYHLVEDYVARRAPLREEHVRLAARYREAGFLMGGAVGDPPVRALLVFAGDSAAAEAFVAEDPYIREGLVRFWEVEPWAVVLGESLGKFTETPS